MTELQDEICDRLVGVNVGPEWAGGPLHTAALVIDPAFTLDHRPDSRPRQIAKALGWPGLFVRAAAGANGVLTDEADRRALAVTLFARVPTGQPVPTPVNICRDAASWACLRAHESACGTACPLHGAAVAVVAAAAVGPGWRHPFTGPVAGRTDCRSAPGLHGRAVTPNSSAAHHAASAIRYLFSALAAGKADAPWPYALRAAAKAEARARGVDAAADFCLTLAGRLGMRA